MIIAYIFLTKICDVDVISVFTRCGALQMFIAFERNSQDLYFNLFTYI